MADFKTYDATDRASIIAHAQKLVGHTLRDCVGAVELQEFVNNRGSFGNAIEKYWFGYEPNSNADADFSEVGMELKTTPMIRRGPGKLQAKERLVLSMIDYFKVLDETPEENILTKKAKDILVMAYEYLRDTAPEDYPIILADELKIPEDDFPQLLADWRTVVQKVRDGKAHEISSSDTLYLEACTKAANSKVRRQQPFGEPAKPRAWAFKRAYIDVLLNGILNAQQIVRADSEKQLSLLELVQKRFAPHIGKTQSELAHELGVRKLQTRPPKNECALITKKILGVSKESEIAEFVKAGIKP